MVDYITNNLSAWNVLSKYDPVSRMPSPQGEFRHIVPIVMGLVHTDGAGARVLLQHGQPDAYTTYLTDYAARLFLVGDETKDPELSTVLQQPAPSIYHIVVAFLRNKFGSGPSDDFKRHHLSAEDVLPRLFLSYAQAVLGVQQHLTYFGEMDAANLCAFFDASNYAKKYGICVPFRCTFAVNPQYDRYTCHA
jgi:hypothetical protein